MSTDRPTSTAAEAGTSRGSSARTFSDRATRLSLLWLFALMNYLYCDVLGLFDATTLKDVINGTGPVDMSQGFLLGSAVLMEIPIAMVLLSVALPPTVSRWASIVAGAAMTVVQLGSLLVGTPTIYYVFFSIIEITATSFIAWHAWTWHRVDA